MTQRTGEKAGWIGGWTGSFLWIFILSVIWLFQGHRVNGFSGIVLSAVAMVVIFLAAPWRHPDTPCWKLMLPLYACLFLSAALAFIHYRPFMDQMNENPLSWLWMIVLVIPLGTMGKRKWNDK